MFTGGNTEIFIYTAYLMHLAIFFSLLTFRLVSFCGKVTISRFTRHVSGCVSDALYDPVMASKLT